LQKCSFKDILHLFAIGIRSFAAKDFGVVQKVWGFVKRFFTALRAELCFERHVISTISLREIVEMTCLSEEYSAAVGGKRLIAQPHYFPGQ
jgi:hypothetical protein